MHRGVSSSGCIIMVMNIQFSSPEFGFIQQVHCVCSQPSNNHWLKSMVIEWFTARAWIFI